MSKILKGEELERKINEGSNFHSDYIEGTKYILPQKHNTTWLNFVSTCYKDIFNGKEVKYIINVLKDLYEDKDYKQINKYIDEHFDSGAIYSRVMKAVVMFGKNGPNFYESIHKDMSEETRAFVNKMKYQNEIYLQELKGNDLIINNI